VDDGNTRLVYDLVSEAAVLVGNVESPILPQWMDRMMMSPVLLERPTRSAISSTLASERSVNSQTPEVAVAAAQVTGTPLVTQATENTRAAPRRATPKANGITPWPPRHAQSLMMSHIYTLTSVNFAAVLEPHFRQPPSIAPRSALAPRVIAHERKRMARGNRRFACSCDFLFSAESGCRARQRSQA
jgi:hypothetical protein